MMAFLGSFAHSLLRTSKLLTFYLLLGFGVPKQKVGHFVLCLPLGVRAPKKIRG